MAGEMIPNDYGEWLEAVKSRIQSARSRAALAVNAELIQLYHSIGSDILDRQTRHGWGSKVIARAAADLKAAFPDMKGFSTSNLKYMRFFAEHCPECRFGQQAADQLPWFHIVTLLTKAEPAEREWYAVHAVAGGWSRHTLQTNLKNRLKQRQGAVPSTNVAACDRPGQGPGFRDGLFHRALKGRHHRHAALSGLGIWRGPGPRVSPLEPRALPFGPRVSPWAIAVRPVGAGNRSCATKRAEMKKQVNANLEGMGYGG